MAESFLVSRTNLADTKLIHSPAAQASPGEAILSVDRFALTANNITYGVAGDIIGYWKFFQAEEGWGRIPVWGIGTVSASEHPDLKIGDRFYGYFPMSSELVVKPDKVNSRGFVEASAHRAELPVIYNQYSILTRGNGFEPGLDNHYMLYRPLFTTSFVLDDYFADNEFFGANTLILGSASSKTAFGLAFMLKQRGDKTIVGLTSTGNVEFCRKTGLYDEVLTYDEVESLGQKPSAYVDMSGNGEVLERVHHHLADNLLRSCAVGVTHHEAVLQQAPTSLPGATPSMFFAPSQIVKRSKELGPDVYQQKIAAATKSFFAEVDDWVAIEEIPFSELDSIYHTVLSGASPDRGYIVTLSENKANQ